MIDRKDAYKMACKIAFWPEGAVSKDDIIAQIEDALVRFFNMGIEVASKHFSAMEGVDYGVKDFKIK